MSQTSDVLEDTPCRLDVTIKSKLQFDLVVPVMEVG